MIHLLDAKKLRRNKGIAELKKEIRILHSWARESFYDRELDVRDMWLVEIARLEVRLRRLQGMAEEE